MSSSPLINTPEQIHTLSVLKIGSPHDQHFDDVDGEMRRLGLECFLAKCNMRESSKGTHDGYWKERSEYGKMCVPVSHSTYHFSSDSDLQVAMNMMTEYATNNDCATGAYGYQVYLRSGTYADMEQKYTITRAEPTSPHPRLAF